MIKPIKKVPPLSYWLRPTFQWKVYCFYCDSKVIIDDRHPDLHLGSRQVGGKPQLVNLIKQVRAKMR